MRSDFQRIFKTRPSKGLFHPESLARVVSWLAFVVTISVMKQQLLVCSQLKHRHEVWPVHCVKAETIEATAPPPQQGWYFSDISGTFHEMTKCLTIS